MTLARATAAAYAGLWGATLIGAALAGLTGVQLVTVDAPRPDVLPVTLQTAGGLLAHNAVVAVWPVALAAVWATTPGLRALGDVLVVASVAAQGLVVGGAIGQHPWLWRWLPHLPLEWLGIAIGAAAWLQQRRRDLPARRDQTAARPVARESRPLARELIAAAGATVATLAVAAAVETWAVPL